MEAAAPPPPLPLLPDFNPGVRCFLDARFRSAADLATAADVEAEIRGRCAELEALVSDLSVRIYEAQKLLQRTRLAARPLVWPFVASATGLVPSEPPSPQVSRTHIHEDSQIESLLSRLLL